MMEMFSNYAVWLFMIGIIAYGMMKKVDCVHACIQGAEKGFAAYLRMLPTMLCMLSAIAVARQSGLLGAITKLLVPAAGWIHLPAEVLPLVILRPFGRAVDGLRSGQRHRQGRVYHHGFQRDAVLLCHFIFWVCRRHKMAVYHPGFVVLQPGWGDHCGIICIIVLYELRFLMV